MIVTLTFGGCVANRAYRAPMPVLHECAPIAKASRSATTRSVAQLQPCQEATIKYSMAFVEFDDLGEMFTEQSQTKPFETTELGQAIEEIKRTNDLVKLGDPDTYPVYIVFIHGWGNNASESSGNVWGFRTALQALADQLKPRPVMGIYLGWRGAVTNVPVVKELSFWNRKNAATRIPGAHLTDALRRITMEAKSSPKAKCIVVGHSFGGLVMERTLTQAMVELILEYRTVTEKIAAQEKKIESGKERLEKEKAQGEDEKIRVRQKELEAERDRLEDWRQEEKDAKRWLRTSLPDLTVLLNEAGPATEAKEFLEFLDREGVEYVQPCQPGDGCDHDEPHPLFLSMTSQGDWATHIIFPVGQFLGKRGLTTRKYDAGGDKFGEADQNHYFLHTTANSPKLVSHEIVTKPKSEPCRPRFVEFSLDGICYSVSRSPNATNDTPYWVLQIPTKFVPDHTTIFNPELRTLLAEFLPLKTDPVLRFKKVEPHREVAKGK